MTRLSNLVPLAALALALSVSVASADRVRDHQMPRWQTSTTESGWRVTGVARHDMLNVRAGPSARYPALQQLRPRARRLEKVACVPTFRRRQLNQLPYRMRERLRAMPTWCLISRDGRQLGWVNAQFLGR